MDAVVAGEERGRDVCRILGKVRQRAVFAEAVDLVNEHDAGSVVGGFLEQSCNALFSRAYVFADNVGTEDRDELVVLIHQLVRERLDDICFTAAGRAYKEIGIELGDLEIFSQVARLSVGDAALELFLHLLHAGYVLKGVLGLLLVPCADSAVKLLLVLGLFLVIGILLVGFL